MSSQDPIGSTIPPERPTNPTHFGGAGLYEPEADEPPRSEETVKRHNLLAWVVVGGIVWLLTALLRRSTERT